MLCVFFVYLVSDHNMNRRIKLQQDLIHYFNRYPSHIMRTH